MAITRTSAWLLGLLVSASLFVSAFAQPQKLMFAFGDSYADTGNRPKSGFNEGRGWMNPYGITWPGYPNGRYSDGKTQTDYYADLLGIPYPPPYLYTTGQSTAAGVNFAVAGSGITYAYGEQPLGGQVDSFELFLRTSPYSKKALANSLSLLAVAGNDYVTFNGSSSELFLYIERVVTGIEASVQRLYDLGLRDIMVTNLLSVGCLPQYTRPSNFQTCNTTLEPYVQIHNAFLLGAMQSINSQNPGARVIILDQYAAFGLLFKQASALGYTDKLVPCCSGINSTVYCGDLDASGKPLYTVCKHRGKAVFWDYIHPTMWAWNYIIKLYTQQPGFILLANAPTLTQWFQVNAAVMEPVAAPMTPPDNTTAFGEWQAAYNSLLSKSNYSEALGLVESLNLEVLLSQYPRTAVTLFLPNNQAFLMTDTGLIDRLVSQDKVHEVGLYHTAQGFFDANTLQTTKPAMLTTLSGAQLPVNYTSQGIFLGPAGSAKVVDPNLYVVVNQVAIHGVDHILIPQGA